MADRQTTEGAQGWMNDVQRALALILIVTFATVVAIATLRVVWWGDANAVAELAKTLQSALVNMSLIALGFFFGNTAAQRDANRGQQNILERLAPPAGPAPSAPPALPTPWWTKLTEDEKHLIVGAKANDGRVDAFITSSTVGSATPADLDYLVSRGLLTPERAEAIKAS